MALIDTVMQLVQTSIIHSINAGGPGSGCQGPTCGRPATGGVPANRVKSTFISPAGFTYTMLRAPATGRPKGSRDSKPRVYEAKLKGEFKQTLNLQKKDQKRVTSVHDAEKQMYKTKGGTTVVVHRNYGKGSVTIHEMRRGEYGHLERTDIFKFRNAGRAAGFLNKRFGIRLKLPK